MRTYTTVQGDTWDQIALKVYGDELLVAPIMACNGVYLRVWRFSQGIVLDVPEVENTGNVRDLPVWRRDG